MHAIGALFVGSVLAEQDMQTREVEQGKHAVTSAWYQVGETQLSFNVVTTVITGLPMGTIVPIQLFLLAVVIGLQTAADKKCGWAEKAVDNMGTATRVVNLACAVALCVLGNPILGGVILGMYAIRFLDEQHKLPKFAKKAYYFVVQNPLILAGGYCLMATGLMFGYAVIHLVVRVAIGVDRMFFVESPIERKPLEFNEPGRLTKDDFFADDLPKLTVDRVAIQKNIPEYKGAVFEGDYGAELLRLFDTNAIEMEGVLREKAEHDDRFKGENAGLPAFRESLVKLLDKVKNETFIGGYPPNYEELEHRLRLIALHCRTSTDNQFVQDCLARLVIDGGEYCQAASVTIILEVYFDVLRKVFDQGDLAHDQKLKLDFYHTLAKARNELFQGGIGSVIANVAKKQKGAKDGIGQRYWYMGRGIAWTIQKTLRAFSDFILNRHIYGKGVVVFGAPFGLWATGVESDAVAQRAAYDPKLWFGDKLMQCATGKSLKSRVRESFENSYNENYIVMTLMGDRGVEVVRHNAIIWVTEWAKRNGVDLREAEQRVQTLFECGGVEEKRAGLEERKKQTARKMQEVALTKRSDLRDPQVIATEISAATVSEDRAAVRRLLEENNKATTELDRIWKAEFPDHELNHTMKGIDDEIAALDMAEGATTQAAVHVLKLMAIDMGILNVPRAESDVPKSQQREPYRLATPTLSDYEYCGTQ